MSTLKVNFAFTTSGDQFAVSAQLKQALTDLDAYNTQQSIVKRQRNLAFEVHIENNAKATTEDVKQVLNAFINNVDAYDVTLECTNNIFNTAKVPAETWQF